MRWDLVIYLEINIDMNLSIHINSNSSQTLLHRKGGGGQWGQARAWPMAASHFFLEWCLNLIKMKIKIKIKYFM